MTRTDAGAGQPLDADDIRSAPSARRRPAVTEHHSAGALVFIDERVLVLRRVDRDEWVFPKGHLEPGEQPGEAAVREVREEAGLTVRLVGSLGTTEYDFRQGRRRQHKRVDWFRAERDAGEISLEPLFCEWRLADRTEAMVLLTHAQDRATAARAFAAGNEGSNR
jgi:diadenosine hexaphosphate hydrolase (ATP-forming)